jgi:hypothetical protein
VSNSSLLVEERFYGWTLIYFERANKDVGVWPYADNSSPSEILGKMLNNSHVYLMGYDRPDLESFQKLYSKNSVAVSQYRPQKY